MHTHFPGENYDTYLYRILTYKRRARPKRVIAGGVTRFIDTLNAPPDYLDTFRPGWTEYVYVDHEKNRATITYSDRTSKQAGIWNLRTGYQKELEELCSTYDTVFIHMDMKLVELIGQWIIPKSGVVYPYKQKLRWAWDIQNYYRDKVKIIPYGQFDYEIYYCMGFAGGGRNIGRFYEGEIVRPDGRDGRTGRGSTWGPFYRYRQENPSLSNLELSIKLLTMTPQINKEYYEQESNPGNRMALASTLDRSDVKNFYFCRNYRNEGKPTAKDNTRPAGSRSLRTDQHRFIAGDGKTCNYCTLSYCCTLYKKDGICVVGDKLNLVKKFGSDNVDDLLDGMSDLLGIQAGELEYHIKEVEDARDAGEKEYDNKINSMINNLMSNSIKVAKLKRPSLANPKLAVNINGLPNPMATNIIEGEVVDPVAQLEKMDDREISNLMREMSTNGYVREKITRHDMVDYISKNLGAGQKSISQGVHGAIQGAF